jgi:hypothetical protein
MTASTAIAWLKANYDDFKQLDLSNSFTLTPDQAIEIAAALETNTNLVELHLQSVRLTNQVASAFAKMLRVNRTLRILDLEDNKIDSDGIEEIGSALAENVGLIELTLFKNREPGEKALSVLIRSFDFNTTLQKINWRLTSRQSFALTKLLSRNVEILRRKDAGMDYSDIDPHCRREKDKELYAGAANSPALRRRRDEDDGGPQSGSSSPALQARGGAAACLIQPPTKMSMLRPRSQSSRKAKADAKPKRKLMLKRKPKPMQKQSESRCRSKGESRC